MSDPDAEKNIARLLSKASTAQRTTEWYKQGQTILTASQFATILKSPRTRGQLVMEKASALADPQKKINCVRTEDIRPFDWGIRFEPIVKQLYENITSSKVADLGRLIHETNKNLAASPDGIVVEGERRGRLVEFKAPITRQIKADQVPEDYWIQMQIQMEVADLNLCDYFEVTLSSPAGLKEWTKPPEEEINYGKGIIFLVGEKEDQQPRYYFYPSFGSNEEPTLKDDEIILERIPWISTKYNLKTVERSSTWFKSMTDQIERFWTDVENAKNGSFVLPDSSRKRKADVCLIVD
jgi:putative phage-type endonuclease